MSTLTSDTKWIWHLDWSELPNTSISRHIVQAVSQLSFRIRWIRAVQHYSHTASCWFVASTSCTISLPSLYQAVCQLALCYHLQVIETLCLQRSKLDRSPTFIDRSSEFKPSDLISSVQHLSEHDCLARQAIVPPYNSFQPMTSLTASQTPLHHFLIIPTFPLEAIRATK